MSSPLSKCAASPCYVIEAQNWEKSRLCRILTDVLPAAVAEVIIDEIHGEPRRPLPLPWGIRAIERGLF